MYRVVLTDEQGLDVLYRDMEYKVLALAWQMWATTNLPCTARIETKTDRRKSARGRLAA